MIITAKTQKTSVSRAAHMYKRNASKRTCLDISSEKFCSYVRHGAKGIQDYLAIPKGRGFVYAHANQL